MWAAEEGYSDTVSVLLEAGANVNIQEHVSVRLKSCVHVCTCTESEMYSPSSHSLQLCEYTCNYDDVIECKVYHMLGRGLSEICYSHTHTYLLGMAQFQNGIIIVLQ